MIIIQRLQYLPTTSSVVPVSSSQKVSLGVTNAESDIVTENAAETPKEAILTEVESTAASEEPCSVTAEVTPPALEPAPTAVTPSPSPAIAAQTTSPAIAEETPSATAEATPPAVEPVPIAAAPSPTPVVAEPTPLPVIAETIPPPAATKPTSPTAETVPAPPPSPSRVAEKNRPVTDGCHKVFLLDDFYKMCKMHQSLQVWRESVSLRKKDLRNVKRDFDIGYEMKKHENDRMSVKLWVEEMMRQSDNPRNWSQNLRRIAGGSEKKSAVFRSLKQLQTELGIDVFSCCLEKVVEDLLNDPDTAEFGRYFLKMYC
ncbi:translation initiation factor IF-2-like [Schistocerca piceifrons]|uniref:translation initiation factor IF-2-like n=1 Tax=Schistocerca piceifrons TaxID=274613 RepID=UPI001F5F09E2|nr:translation initiation factor IF-2-like [Schistocerca piceifrons]